jgi:hypothetical protein
MPFKSKAQRRKFAELLVNGKITDEQYEEWNRSTGKKELPERLHPASGGKKKTTVKKKTTAKKKTPARKKSTARKKTTKKKATKKR